MLEKKNTTFRKKLKNFFKKIFLYNFFKVTHEALKEVITEVIDRKIEEKRFKEKY